MGLAWHGTRPEKNYVYNINTFPEKNGGSTWAPCVWLIGPAIKISKIEASWDYPPLEEILKFTWKALAFLHDQAGVGGEEA